jgi:hypothetical protein
MDGRRRWMDNCLVALVLTALPLLSFAATPDDTQITQRMC